MSVGRYRFALGTDQGRTRRERRRLDNRSTKRKERARERYLNEAGRVLTYKEAQLVVGAKPIPAKDLNRVRRSSLATRRKLFTSL